MKLLLLWLAFLAGIVSASAQAVPSTAIRPLTIGDTVPDIELTNLINYPSKTARLSDFKGKMVIIDFWATWCGPCVAALPKMNALQKEFGERLQIIAVTMENRQKVLTFLEKYKAAREISSILLRTDDSLMSVMFPHKSIPHTVWIGADKQVKAITSGEYVISKNIKAILENKNVNWRLKDESSVFPYKDASIFDLSNLANTTLNFHSGFTGYIEGVSRGLFIKVDSINKQIRYNQYNLSILSLYSIGYGEFSAFQNPKRCVLFIKDSSKYFRDYSNEYYENWIRKNWYSYESVSPITYSDQQLQEKLIHDLNFFFRVDSKKENRIIPCLILKRLPNSIPMSTEGGLPQRELFILKDGKSNYVQKNNRLSEFVFVMNNDLRLKQLPLVIDETGYSEPLDLTLTIDKNLSIDGLRKALNAYGLDIVIEPREMSMLIIQEL
ncbi:MAG: TlpA family protein disulfide reductase [Chitinophagaceae bacterium]|nr:TlpA family protein disulfide reductase [Chitinophagaceae bacterium]